MLPRVDTNIRPIASIEAPSAVASIGVTKQEVANRLDQLVIGKQIQGEILSRLNDGTFFVKLAGATARMALPQNTKVGEYLPLTLVALTPRPTFLLDVAHGNTTTTAAFSRQDLIANFLQEPNENQASLPDKKPVSEEPASYILKTEQGRTSSILPNKAIIDSTKINSGLEEEQGLSANSTPTSLSDTGKLINNILLKAQQDGAPSALIGKTPLLQNVEELKHPDKLASHLQQTISSSGIFYESHVANWVEGKLSQADLMREPQAQVANATAINLINPNGEDNSTLAQIIHLQLDVLEQQRIAWQGNLLPDIPIKWEITQERPHTQQETTEQESTWQSVVRFELPQLGVVAATINLHAGQLQLFLRSDTEETVALLKTHSSDLMEALKQSGAALDFLNIKRDEQA